MFKCIHCLAIGAVAGMALGAAAITVVSTPKAKRLCRSTRRKLMQCAQKLGL